MKPVKNVKTQANKVYGYRLNSFTVAGFSHKRFAAIEVVPSPPLPRSISNRSLFQAIGIGSFGFSVSFSIIQNLK